VGAGTEVVCAGILVADHVCTPMAALPAEGHLVAVDAMYLLTGGCAANVGVNVARQGIGVRVVGCVGDDVWGRFVREDLAARGADTGAVRVSATSQTSQTMILLCKGEDRRFVHTFGANRELRAGDVERRTLRGAKVLYVGGYLVMPGVLPAELGELFAWAREAGLRTVLDVVVPMGFRYGGELEPVLPHTDVFLPNDDEAEVLTGEIRPERQAQALRRLGAGTVLVTLGGEGLVFTEGDAAYRAGRFESEVVDPTGAGDAFCAGFITGIVRGMEPAECVRYGSALGASCVRSIGCYQGVFTAEEARDFLATHPLPIERVG
jgi:sugar/nucleoside kinase (ribokinase family)